MVGNSLSGCGSGMRSVTLLHITLYLSIPWLYCVFLALVPAFGELLCFTTLCYRLFLGCILCVGGAARNSLPGYGFGRKFDTLLHFTLLSAVR